MTKEDILEIDYEGLIYPSSENAYQAQKCLNEKDKKKFICYNPSESKKEGMKVNIVSDWNDKRITVMENIVFAKFKQNSNLKEKLINTGDEELIEHNYWNDRFWGRHFGVGANHLGLILMMVRETLKRKLKCN